MSEPALLDELLAGALELSDRQLNAAQVADWERVAALQQELEAIFRAEGLRTLSDRAGDRFRASFSELADRNQAVLGLVTTARDEVAAAIGELRAGRQATRAYADASR